VDPRGYKLEVDEFDCKGENQIIYDENGGVRSADSLRARHGLGRAARSGQPGENSS